MEEPERPDSLCPRHQTPGLKDGYRSTGVSREEAGRTPGRCVESPRAASATGFLPGAGYQVQGTDRVAGLEEAAVTCCDLGAAGSLSTQARPLPWPHLPQVSLRKTNAA